jgi:hypothetical protein
MNSKETINYYHQILVIAWSKYDRTMCRREKIKKILDGNKHSR